MMQLVRQRLPWRRSLSQAAIDGVSPRRLDILLRKRDPAADGEEDVAISRLCNRPTFADGYLPGTLEKEAYDFVDAVEIGKAAPQELKEYVDNLSPENKLVFYKVREFYFSSRLDSVNQDQLKSAMGPFTDDAAMSDLMADAVGRFRQLGLQIQKESLAAAAGAKLTQEAVAAPIAPVVDDVARSPSGTKMQIKVLAEDALYSTNPVESHTVEDIGKFFVLPDIAQQGLPGGWLKGEFDLTQCRKILLRGPMYRIAQSMKQAKSASVIIGGHRPGSGRSTALAYATCVARAQPQQWLTIYFPDAAQISDSGHQMVESKCFPGKFIQPVFQSEWFSALISVHSEQLSRIPLQTATRETYGTSLLELVKAGILDEEGDTVIHDFFAELALVDDIRILLAIDNINTWDRPSAYFDPVTEKPLDSRRLVLVDYLADFIPRNGVRLTAMTSKLPSPQTKSLLRDSGQTIVTIPGYSPDEFLRVVSHWIHAGLVFDVDTQDDGLEQFILYVRALSGGNPKEVSRVLQSI